MCERDDGSGKGKGRRRGRQWGVGGWLEREDRATTEDESRGCFVCVCACVCTVFGFVMEAVTGWATLRVFFNFLPSTYHTNRVALALARSFALSLSCLFLVCLLALSELAYHLVACFCKEGTNPWTGCLGPLVRTITQDPCE